MGSRKIIIIAATAIADADADAAVPNDGSALN